MTVRWQHSFNRSAFGICVKFTVRRVPKVFHYIVYIQTVTVRPISWHSFIQSSCVNKSNTKNIYSFDKNKFRSIEIESNPEIINNAFNLARWMWSWQIDGEFHHRTIALHKSTRWMFGFVIRWRHIVRYNMRWIVIGRWANVCLLFSSIDIDWTESGCARTMRNGVISSLRKSELLCAVLLTRTNKRIFFVYFYYE